MFSNSMNYQMKHFNKANIIDVFWAIIELIHKKTCHILVPGDSNKVGGGGLKLF